MVRPKVILVSFALTVLIFAFGILLNYALDFVRIDSIAGAMEKHELDTTAYIVEQEFLDAFGSSHCGIMQARISHLKNEIHNVGSDLGSYSAFSIFRKQDYDYLKRKYFLLELRFLALIEELNRNCQRPYVPILFFYSIDDEASERQGFILEDISRGYEQQVVVLALDKDYADEPLVQLLVEKYNVTAAPTIIISREKREGLVFTGELNATVRRLLRKADPAAAGLDFSYVLKAAGRDVGGFAENLSQALQQDISPMARADVMLMLGRITRNDSMICDSLGFYDKALGQITDAGQKALVYETMASIGCDADAGGYLRMAAQLWKELNAPARAGIISSLAESQKPEIKFDTSGIVPALSAIPGASRVIIGKTAITISAGQKVLVQADRVKRDWLGLQVNDSIFGSQILGVFSEGLLYNESELRSDIGWHEGARIGDLASAGIVPVVAYGTLAARLDGRWFAMADDGVFRFQVPVDKVLYPSTRFLRDDLAVIMDTHGVNMLVEQALRNNVSAVMACCDHPGKVKAAKYLSDRGVSVICNADLHVYLALGHNLSVAGSPPVSVSREKAVFGSRPVAISVNEPVIVMNATDSPYALWYYQAPARYFAALSAAVPLNLSFVQINGFGQMKDVVAEARRKNSSVIAARVFDSNDYWWLKSWLQESQDNRAVLFHSASYPYGMLLLREFPVQASFDDPNPGFG